MTVIPSAIQTKLIISTLTHRFGRNLFQPKAYQHAGVIFIRRPRLATDCIYSAVGQTFSVIYSQIKTIIVISKFDQFWLFSVNRHFSEHHFLEALIFRRIYFSMNRFSRGRLVWKIRLFEKLVLSKITTNKLLFYQVLSVLIEFFFQSQIFGSERSKLARCTKRTH